MAFSSSYTITHADGGQVTVHSLDAFEREALDALVCRLAYKPPRQVREGGDTNTIGETVDLLVPSPEDWEKLLTFVSWNPAFFTDDLEYYAEGNRLSFF